MTREALKEKANALPQIPGVYLMMDKSGLVIYVGKAKKLKNRVSQYFQDSAAHTIKTRRMVTQIDHFDTIFVNSEFEALILENALIKRHQPHYNILLKDDKSYPFIRLSREEYPRFSLTNRPANDSARYFGPFGGRSETRQALDAVLAALHLPNCNRKFPRDIGTERPCLNFHMKRCDGFCRSDLNVQEYQRRIAQVVQILEGKSKNLIQELTDEMNAASEHLRFEEAAILRDRIQAIQALSRKQTVISGLCSDTDVWGICPGIETENGYYAILHMEKGNLISREISCFAAPLLEKSNPNHSELLTALISQYYLSRSILPREILLPFELEIPQEIPQTLAEILSKRAGYQVQIHVPKRGKKAELLTIAQRNAIEETRQNETSKKRTAYTLQTLGELLNLSKPPERIEAFDISHMGGSEISGSMIVYQGTRPLKSAYRRFQIQEQEQAGQSDDYASMREVLRRRLQNAIDQNPKFLPLPNIFLIDGGAAHAQTVLSVMQEFAQKLELNIPVFGMVKDDRHRTRALITPDGQEISISANPTVFALIGQIQEEAHRFAISYHRERHRKQVTKSLLDDIPGIGPKRRELLRKHFGSIQTIQNTEISALESVLPKQAAQAVWDYFHTKKPYIPDDPDNQNMQA